MHSVLVDKMRTSCLDMSQTADSDDIDAFLTKAVWENCATHHTVLQSMPGAAIIGQDMLLDIPYMADQSAIGQCQQQAVNHHTERLNKKHLDLDYTIGQKVLLPKIGVLQKAEDKYTSPWTITQVHCNGTVKIRCGIMSEWLNIRRITPFFE